jgi:DNA-binding transcriptional ArsR family regulator
MAEGGEYKIFSNFSSAEEKYFFVVKDLDERIKKNSEEKFLIKNIDEEIREVMAHLSELKSKKWVIEKRIQDREELMEFWKEEMENLARMIWGRSRPSTPGLDKKESE